MANLKDIKNRIKGVKSTQKITKAMKMISTARLNKARSVLTVASQYHNATQSFVHSLISTLDLFAIESTIPFVQNIIGKNIPKKTMIIAFTTDKGLCGALNTLVLRELEAAITPSNILYVIGKKGFDYTKTRHKMYNERAVLSARFNIEEITQNIMQAIENEGITDIKLIFPKFISTMVQKPFQIAFPEKMNDEYEFFQIDESPKNLLENAVKNYIGAMIYSCFAELLCSEHSARMIAMDNATNNAKAKITNLTLIYNKTRQANITREILEIISGSQAV